MASGSVLPFTVMRFDLQDRKFFLGFFRGPRFVAAEMHPQLAMNPQRRQRAIALLLSEKYSECHGIGAFSG